MKPEPAPSESTGSGATAVITHRVRAGCHEAYAEWLQEIAPVCQGFPGYLDMHRVLPVPGLTCTYTIVVRFDTDGHLAAWMHSPERKELISKVHPLLATGDDFFIRSGLDFWFTPEGARTQVPVRWKQFLVTWSAIFPLVLAVSAFMAGLFSRMHLPDETPFLRVLLTTGCVVFLMTYVVMPHYTKLLKRWLFS